MDRAKTISTKIVIGVFGGEPLPSAPQFLNEDNTFSELTWAKTYASQEEASHALMKGIYLGGIHLRNLEVMAVRTVVHRLGGVPKDGDERYPKWQLKQK